MALNPDRVLELLMQEFPKDHQMGLNDGPNRMILVTKKNANCTGRKFERSSPEYVPKYAEIGRMAFAEFLMIVSSSLTEEHAVKRCVKRIVTGIEEQSDALPPSIQEIVNKAVADALASKMGEMARREEAALPPPPPVAVPSRQKDPERAKRDLVAVEWAKAHGMGGPVWDRRGHLANWWLGKVRKAMAREVNVVEGATA